MRNLFFAALAGIVFGIGLAMSQMIDPARILGFLTLQPGWDPTLMYVMAGALLVAIPGYALLKRRQAPWFAEEFAPAPSRRIDGRLIGGSILFGLGWGLSGYCPGPALIAAGLGYLPVLLLFIPGILLGAWLAGLAGKQKA